MAAPGAEAAQMPFIKNLASSDRKLRTESLSTLKTFLASRHSLTSQDAFKLWTGLYYALWMTDRPRPQQALASDLADLLFDLRPACAAPWLRAFWSVLSAQWPHIEALRLDKFMLLVRRVFNAQLRWAKKSAYQGSQVQDVLLALRETCFDVDEENKTALGIRLHVLDIWVDELETAGVLPAPEEGSDQPALDPHALAFVQSLGEMVEALRRCPPPALRERAKETYGDERLPWVEKKQESDEEAEAEAAGQVDDDDDDEGWAGLAD